MGDYDKNQKDELELIKTSMDRLQDKGIIKYSLDGDDTFKIQFNEKFISDILEYLSDIPLPLHIYKNIKRDYRRQNDRIQLLSIFLAQYALWFNDMNRDIRYLKSQVRLNESYSHDRRVGVFAMFIQKFYNFDTPVEKPESKGFYWFRVKDEMSKEFRGM